MDRYTGCEAGHKDSIFFSSREQAKFAFEKGRLIADLVPRRPIRNFDSAVVEYYRNNQVNLDQLIAYYEERKRRCAMILDAYKNGGELTAIVLLHVNDRYYELVSGNTRLVFAQVLKKKPFFWVIDVQ